MSLLGCPICMLFSCYIFLLESRNWELNGPESYTIYIYINRVHCQKYIKSRHGATFIFIENSSVQQTKNEKFINFRFYRSKVKFFLNSGGASLEGTIEA